MQFTIEDVLSSLDHATYESGVNAIKLGEVGKITRGNNLIKGEIKVNRNRVYGLEINLFPNGAATRIEGHCDCSVGYNCKHVAAVLLTCLDRQAEASPPPAPAEQQHPLPPAFTAWLQRVEAAAHPALPDQKALALLAAASGAPAPNAHRLLFVLAPDSHGRHVALALCKARLHPNGEVASASTITEVFSLMTKAPSFMEPRDEDLVRLYIALRTGAVSLGGQAVEPKGKIGAQMLQLALAQDQLLWANSWNDLAGGLLYPLKSTGCRNASLSWIDQGGNARLAWQLQPVGAGPDDAPPAAASLEPDHILPTDPPWYIDNLSCGELNLRQNGAALPELQALVAQAPLLAARDRVKLSQQLLVHGLQHLVPMPERLEQLVRDDVKVKPCLLLGSIPAMGMSQLLTPWHDFALLAFDYDGEKVPLDPTLRVVRQKGQVMEVIRRDEAAEKEALRILADFGFAPPEDPDSPLNKLQGSMQLPSQAAWLRFTAEHLPGLAEQGWRIEKTKEYRFNVSRIEGWYATVDEHSKDSGNAWFDLELGVVLNQTKVSLLPVLVQLIRNAPYDFSPESLASVDGSDLVLALLPDGLRVALPWGRIKPILGALGELYFSDKGGPTLRLSGLDAARIAELDAGTELEWSGGERLREIGHKLRQFGGVRQAEPPQGLRATLREYQSEGVAWMQFLREHDLAGILADDMGLGKTVQTLAHILIEKESGRLTHPVLVVAPTSLMGNWQDEAARFAPDLRVLLLHGPERLPRFEQIQQHDLVLTTYSLLPRDEAKLKQHNFHMVILDESQYIKNAHAKATQTAGVLKARHRLCLTGTPLENHLGELWSQFHFLLPGLLGHEKVFTADFRTPIEKQGNTLRRALLASRIKPFLLRRTKDKVAKELPPKTEIVRHVELTGTQRDLYETVRLAMDTKVREEVSKKGVGRSQIVILEALLKLRQVCCDPRLVRGESARKHHVHSAKLAELMQMLDEMLQENRKILVFSAFTGMLDLIEDEVKMRGVQYALLTGESRDRAAQIKRFQQGKVPLFLISLKAGGVGLNLTAADTVIHYDPWWNPAAENQASDRAWRIGQDKPVFVYKLIAGGTVEEKIQALQMRKKELAQSLLAEGGVQDLKLTQEDLQAIFAPLDD